tara:strand:- start:326 stop:505 length:180 start_codon:yes stop_codon:yes gene_type:complete
MVDYTTVLKDDYENLKEDYRLLEEITEDLDIELQRARFFIFLSGMVGFVLGIYSAILVL